MAESTNKKSLKVEVSKIDPMFNIPVGVTDLEYTEDSSLDLRLTQDDNGNYIYTPPGGIQSNQYGLPTPNIIGVVSQTIRTAKSGSQVVDVVIEADDIPGVRYEVRVNKV